MSNEVEIQVGARDNSKLGLDQLKARLDELGRKVETARVDVKGDKEAELSVAKLDAQLDRLGRKIASPKISAEGAGRASIEIAGVDLAVDRLNEKLRGSTGLRGMLSGAASGFESLIGPISGTAGTIGAILIPLAALAAIMAGPLIASFAPIIAGFAAFGAGAVGEIKKVLAAQQSLTAAQAAYEKATTKAGKASALKAEKEATDGLTGSEKGLLGMLGSLGKEFGKLETAVKPEVVRAFGSALHILKDLMPALTPLAKAAGKAIDGFLNNIDKWLQSDSGKKFLKWMQSDGPHAIETFGHVMWSVAQGIGQAFAFLRNAGNSWWKHWDQMIHDAARVTDVVREAWIRTGHAIEAAWNSLVAHARSAQNEVRGAFSALVGFIIGIPGRVAGALSRVFHPLIAAGQAAYNFIAGIVSRIEGALSGLGSAVNNALGGIPSKVLHFLGLASGGIVGAAAGGVHGGMRLVGEHGPELVSLPRGSMVHSNPDTERMLSGGGGGGGLTIVLENHGAIGSQMELENWLTRSLDNLHRKGRLPR